MEASEGMKVGEEREGGRGDTFFIPTRVDSTSTSTVNQPHSTHKIHTVCHVARCVPAQPPTVACQTEAQLEVASTFFFACYRRRFVSSVGSLSRVRCWLGACLLVVSRLKRFHAIAITCVGFIFAILISVGALASPFFFFFFFGWHMCNAHAASCM